MKRSNDLEVYEIEQPSKQRLEEVCDIRQPTTFEYYNEHLLTALSYNGITTNYRAFDIQVRDVSVSDDTKPSSLTEKTQKGNDTINNSTVLYIPVPLKIAHEVFHKDTEAKYISENNTDFIEETGLLKVFQLNDDFLRPYMVSTCMYDVMLASASTITPLRYEVNYRNYFLVTQGRVKILLIPPKDSKYLYPISDYDIFEFRSPVNPWKVQPEYQNDFDKIKTLEVELFQGMIMYIPAYWWYSIKFVVSETSICSFKYRTHMNSISVLPLTMMNLLQNMNIKRDTLEKRAYIPDLFKPKSATPGTPATAMNTSSERSYTTTTTTNTTNTTTASNPSASSTINPQHYHHQYLPASMRNNPNPFSITSAITAPTVIPDGDNQVISSVLGTTFTEPTTNGFGTSNNVISSMTSVSPAEAAASSRDIIESGTISSGGGVGSVGGDILPSSEYRSEQKEVTVL